MNYLLFLWWLGTFLSLIGAFYISNHKRIGFLYWCFSNPLIILQCYLSSSWNLVLLYFVFWILAVRGYTKKPKEKEVSYQEAMNIVFKPKTDSFTYNNPIKKD